MPNSSFDNFQLPPSLLVKLYKNSLFDLEQPQAIPESLNESSPVSLGHFQKKILILVHEPGDLHLNDGDLQFLTGMLNACQWSLADVALVNRCSNPTWNWATLIQHFQPVLSIGFGINEADYTDLGLNQPYQITLYNNTRMLLSSKLSLLAQRPDEKKAIWNCLKSEISR
jgi:hypothetical protein